MVKNLKKPSPALVRRILREELFTTPRIKEYKVVKSILREYKIKYQSREEKREFGWRYCIYVSPRDVNRAAKIVDEELIMRGM